MRVNQVLSSRPQFYDRNPLAVIQSSGSAGNAPIGSTVDWSYTVPAGRKAQVTSTNIVNVRDAVATTAGEIRITIAIIPSGGSITNFMTVTGYDNTVGPTRLSTTGQAIFLGTGDLLRGLHQDLSTGGTFAYAVRASVTEFDA